MNEQAWPRALALIALSLLAWIPTVGRSQMVNYDRGYTDALPGPSFPATADAVFMTTSLADRFRQLSTWAPPEQLPDRSRVNALPPLLPANPNPFLADTRKPRPGQPFWSTARLAALVPPPADSRNDIALRGGWWTVDSTGNPFKVNQFESPRSSPFWDVDQLYSTGTRTVDFSATGLDNDTTASRLYFFGPRHAAGVSYQRFLRRLDHDPLDNFPPPASGDEIVHDDLNVGDDYAIRVQDLRTFFKGRLGKKVKYRVNLWLLRKKGDRQALATQHAVGSTSNCTNCHTTSQTQKIDWLTAEIEPVVETRLGPVSIVYSRPMRMFSQSDQVVIAPFGDGHVYKFGGDYPYAVVPDNFTQIDRLRAGVDLTRFTHFYAHLYSGDTKDQLRDTDRRFYGFDLRLTNRHWRQLDLTGFARMNRQLNEFPPFYVDPEGTAVATNTSIVPPYGLRNPIDYLRLSTGANATWRPFRDVGVARGLRLNSGVEYGSLSRSYAVYQSQNPPDLFDEGRTVYISYSAGANMKWNQGLDTFVRYRGRHTQNPLYGVDQYAGITNTNRPDQEDLVEIGGTWFPIANLMASASVGLENRQNHSANADFVEDNYPMTFTAWYAPQPSWSLSAGYGYYTNWIDQYIYFPSDDPNAEALDRSQWNYGGRAQVLSFGASHVYSEQLTLSAGLEYVWARNRFDPLAPWPDLPDYSQVIVNKTRYTAGIDWAANNHISAYARYIYQDYSDISSPRISGISHMFLIGLTGYY